MVLCRAPSEAVSFVVKRAVAMLVTGLAFAPLAAGAETVLQANAILGAFCFGSWPSAGASGSRGVSSQESDAGTFAAICGLCRVEV